MKVIAINFNYINFFTALTKHIHQPAVPVGPARLDLVIVPEEGLAPPGLQALVLWDLVHPGQPAEHAAHGS